MTFRRRKPIETKLAEYGRRPYVSQKTYVQQFRTPTFANLQARGVHKESILAQPYNNDGPYSEMEHWWPPIPGININWPAVPDYPWMTPLPDIASMYDIVFIAWSYGCWVNDDEQCFEIHSSFPITLVEVVLPEPSTVFGKNEDSGQYCITASGETGQIYLDVHMVTPVNDVGIPAGVAGVSRIHLSECLDQCTPDAAMAWDDATSADTVARSASVTVAVTGNNGPFAWSVSGTGFTLDFAETDGLENTLNADGSACGSATVTVTGCDETAVTGYVRCTTGQWTRIQTIDRSAYCKNTVGGLNTTTVISGKYRYVCRTGYAVEKCTASNCSNCAGIACVGTTNSCGNTTTGVCAKFDSIYYALTSPNTNYDDGIDEWVC